MIESTDSKKQHNNQLGTGSETLATGKRTFWLKDLGSRYKIEKTEDWPDYEGEKRPYAEMIRVRGSKDVYRKGISPVTGLTHEVRCMSSNLSKYSETQLMLYMKDHKSRWPKLAEITGEQFNGFDPYEEYFIFPIEKFREIEKVIRFREKRTPSKAFLESGRKTQFKPKHGDNALESLSVLLGKNNKGQIISPDIQNAKLGSGNNGLSEKGGRE